MTSVRDVSNTSNEITTLVLQLEA